jgi:hypothetical protein
VELNLRLNKNIIILKQFFTSVFSHGNLLACKYSHPIPPFQLSYKVDNLCHENWLKAIFSDWQKNFFNKNSSPVNGLKFMLEKIKFLKSTFHRKSMCYVDWQYIISSDRKMPFFTWIVIVNFNYFPKTCKHCCDVVWTY